jgi:hypothetical protein
MAMDITSRSNDRRRQPARVKRGQRPTRHDAEEDWVSDEEYKSESGRKHYRRRDDGRQHRQHDDSRRRDGRVAGYRGVRTTLPTRKRPRYRED